MGETGLDYFRGYAARATDSATLFEAQLELPAELGKPVVIHTREADADTADVLAGFDGDRRPALLLLAGPARRPRSSAATTSRSPATSRTRRRTTSARAAAQVPAERLLAETDSPYLAPQARRGRPNEPANVVLTVADARRGPRRGSRRARRQIDANAAAAFSLP